MAAMALSSLRGRIPAIAVSSFPKCLPLRWMSSVEILRQKSENKPWSRSTDLAMGLRPTKTNVSPEVLSAVAEVKACTKRRDVAGAMAVLHQAKVNSVILHNAVLTACAKGHDPTAAWNLWQSMDEKNIVSYSIMIGILGASLQIEKAESLWAEMLDRGLQPNVLTYTTMINAYGQSSKVDQALGIFDQLKASCTADGMAYLTAMSGCARVGDYERTRNLFVEMTTAGIKPESFHFNSLITACARNRYADVADTIFRSMPQYGLTHRVEDFTALISCCISEVDRCRKILEELRSAGLQPTKFTLQEVVQAELEEIGRAHV